MSETEFVKELERRYRRGEFEELLNLAHTHLPLLAQELSPENGYLACRELLGHAYLVCESRRAKAPLSNGVASAATAEENGSGRANGTGPPNTSAVDEASCSAPPNALVAVDNGSTQLVPIAGRRAAGEDWSGRHLVRAELSGKSLECFRLVRADLRLAHLHRSVLHRADLTEADLSGADLREADLSWAVLTRTLLLRTHLEGARLPGADLAHARLRDAHMCNAFLPGATLAHADLEGADLQGADLTGADLSGAYLEGATFAGCRLEYVRYNSRTHWPHRFNPDAVGAHCVR